jgi:ubiquinone/menaquinone biosynthesis C-methylase UbiE/glycosyltransferase involved in cell wall biosynthesis
MKLLHLGNIANMAYGYSKIMHEYQAYSDVLCYDLKHVLSLPETYESIDIANKISGEFIKDEFFADLNSLPRWYKRVEIKSYYNTLGRLHKSKFISREWCSELTRFSKRYGKRFALKANDITDYRLLTNVLSGYFLYQYDLVFAYAYAAVPMLLHAQTQYIPIEIGTLRHIPFEDSSFGRLMALSYRTAPHVIITNADVISSVKALELDNYSYLPHPVIVDKTNRNTSSLNLRQKFPDTFILFAPARQNWEVKGNDKYLKAFAELIKKGVKAKLIIPFWGQDVVKSTDLIKELNIEPHVLKINLLSERELTDYYHEVDIVLDQFGDHKTFGLIAPKASAAGAAVLVSFDETVHHWCFAEMPPFINAFTEKEIFDALFYYSKHQNELTLIKDRGKRWVAEHHSAEIIYKKIQSIQANMKEKKTQKQNTVFTSLRQKKVVLEYDTKNNHIYGQKYHDAQAHQLMDQNLYQYLRQELTDINSPKILHLGCGPGSMMPYLKLIKNAELYGIDISETMIDLAQKKYPDIHFQVGDAETLTFDDETFDLVFIDGLIHIFPILDLALKEIKRILKPGGLLFVREPNEKNFAALYPSESIVHACLRHTVYLSSRDKLIFGPEPNDSHISFTYHSLVEVLSQYFNVSNLYSDTKVSYVYDMLYHPKYREPIQKIEATLAKIPGFNIIVAARKVENIGIAEAVIKTMSQFDNIQPLSLEHFKEFLSFAEKYWGQEAEKIQQRFEHYKLKNIKKFDHAKFTKPQLVITKDQLASHVYDKSLLPSKMSLLKKSLISQVKKSAIAQTLFKTILNISIINLKNQLLDMRLKKAREVAFMSLDSDFNDILDNTFGSGKIELFGEVSGQKIVQILSKIREYANITIVINRNCSITNLNEEVQASLFQYMILDKIETIDKVILLISSSIYCLSDVYKALDLALTRYDDPSFNHLKSIVHHKNAELKQASSGFNLLGTFVAFIKNYSAIELV